MNFSPIKNIHPIVLYLISVICFVLSNVVRDKYVVLYYVLLIAGALFFIFGFFRARK